MFLFRGQQLAQRYSNTALLRRNPYSFQQLKVRGLWSTNCTILSGYVWPLLLESRAGQGEDTMSKISRVLIILGLLVVSAVGAMAGEIRWTFSDVLFDNGNTATGYFITDSSLIVQSFSLMVSGPAMSQDFIATQFVQSYLPSQVGFANSGFSSYVSLYLTSPITNAGGIIPFGPGLYGDGFDCGGGGGCGTLLLGNGNDPELIGTPVSEPSVLLILGGSLALLGTMLRRAMGHS